MQLEWYGQSAFRLSTPDKAVVIDPWGDLSPTRERNRQSRVSPDPPTSR